MMSEPIKVLVVDDARENRVALEAMLQRDGVQPLLASSGTEALELLEAHEVALAVVDIRMPAMDGFELADQIHAAERTRHVPIIFVANGYEPGAVDLVFRPIDPRILKGKVDVFLDLAAQRRQVNHLLRLNETFVGILGHDLRNPLAAMTAGAELLATQLTDERQLTTLGRMTRAGRRMATMIEQLLDLTRARLGGGLGFVRARETVDVAELVQRTIDELQGTHPGRAILFEASGDCSAAGDPERLLQLFGNLVSNALSHGAGASIEVAVAGGRDAIAVEVRNQGAIPPERVPTLFEPFARKDASRSTGLGLGLFISRQIAVAHGGDISVASTAGETCVTVRLPRQQAIAAPAEP